jgi:hypothetical protein
LSLGSLASLEVLPDKSVLVVGPAGITHFAVKSGGGFEAPHGDSNLKLTAEENGKNEVIAYTLEDASDDTSTKFMLPSSAKAWMPTLSKGPTATDTMADEYTTAEPEAGKKVVEPTLEVAPHPSATCEYKKLEKGCRALEFVYDTGGTTAKGENRSEWGDYKGRLKEVIFIAYNPSPSVEKMTETPVARYEYDKQGRLRAEWNPSIPSELKTVYGYDAEGHVTALAPAGGEAWAFTYGTTQNEPVNTGRLLKVTRAPASAALWAGNRPVNTEAPKLSGSPVEGTKLSVSNGVWSNSPVTYVYQWEDCNSEGTGCDKIIGATNPSYTDTNFVGQTLVAEVTAINAGGSVTASSAHSGLVTVSGIWVVAGAQGKGAGQFETPEATAVNAKNDVWVADMYNNRIDEFSESGEFLMAVGWGIRNGEGALETCKTSCLPGLVDPATATSIAPRA